MSLITAPSPTGDDDESTQKKPRKNLKRPASSSANARASRAKPATSLATTLSRPSDGRIERPITAIRGHRPALGPLNYASDCSGLDAGAFALKYIHPRFQHVWASEVDPSYRSILRATHPEVATVYHDIAQRPDDALDPHVGNITVYTSGFPCVSFSKAGSQQGHKDPDNGLISFYVAVTICKVLPDMFILENVPEFATDRKHHGHFDVTMRMLRNAGSGIYSIYWKVLNSKDYGVPAQRKRLFIVGLRTDRLHTQWAWPKIERAVGLDSIFDEIRLTARQQHAQIDALAPFAMDNLAKGLEHVVNNSGGRKGHWVIDVGTSKSRRSAPFYNQMPTITKARAKKCEWFITNHGLVSESELLRCQGFDPKQVVVPGNVKREKLCEMIGNAMTVTVMSRLLMAGLIALGRS